MSLSEILTILVACLAVLLGIYQLHINRKTNDGNNANQKPVIDLSSKQLEMIKNQEEDSKLAKLEPQIKKCGNHYNIEITNTGKSEARKVNFTLIETEENYLLDQEIILPIEKLQANESLYFPAVLDQLSIINIEISWVNSNDQLFTISRKIQIKSST